MFDVRHGRYDVGVGPGALTLQAWRGNTSVASVAASTAAFSPTAELWGTCGGGTE